MKKGKLRVPSRDLMGERLSQCRWEGDHEENIG
jgi:hypothetical protein